VATVGSISIALRADSDAFVKGIESSLASIGLLEKSLTSLRSTIRSVADETVRVSVDSSAVSVAGKTVSDLQESISGVDASIEIEADVTEVEAAVEAAEEVSEAVERVAEAADESTSSVKKFAEDVSDALTRSADDAVAGGEAFAQMRDSISALSSAAASVLTGVASAASATGRAVEGLGNAFASVTSGGGLSNVTEAAIVAAGRVDDAVRSIASLAANLTGAEGAIAAAGSAIYSLGATIGGVGTVVAAFSGSAAAAAIVAGSLASSLASAGVAALTYAGVMAVARAATAGMGEEAQAYAERGGALVAALISARVAAEAGTRVYGIVANAIFTSSSATAALSSSLTGLAGAFSAGVAAAQPMVSAGAALVDVFGILGAVASKTNGQFDNSASSIAGLIARMAAMRVGISAAIGAAGGLVAGTGAVAGAAAGASAAIAGLGTMLPVYAAAAVVAAVASGRVAEELRHAGNAAQLLGDLADRFGKPVQEIEKLKIAAENANISLQSVVRAQQNFAQSLSKVKIGQLNTTSAREAKIAFDKLGVSMQELNSLSPDDVFKRVAAEITKIEDPAEKTQMAMDLFGRQGPNLLPLLRNLEKIEADIDRLGGTISDLDFERFAAVGESFNRLATASGALRDDLVIPFTRMQEAFNNAKAEIIGGLAPLIGAFGEVIADISAPFAVLAEVIGRIVGTILRAAAAATKLVAAFLPFAAIANLAELAGDAFNELFSYVEALVSAFDGFASAVEESLRPTIELFNQIGETAVELMNILTGFLGLGDVFGPVTASLIALSAAFLSVSVGSQFFSAVMSTTAGTAIASAVTTAAAWVAAGVAITAAVVVAAATLVGVYIASVLAATATTIASCAAMHVAWLFGLGPIGLLVAGIELLVVSAGILWAMGSSVVEFFSGWGEGAEKINAATAAAEELAEVVAESEKPRESGFLADMEALAKAAGFSQEEIDATKAKMEEYASEVEAAVTDSMSGLTDATGEAFGYSQEEVDQFKTKVAGLYGSVKGLFGLGGEVEIESTSAERAKEVIGDARGEMQLLTIEAARLGGPGADAVAAATEEFNALQQKLADGTVTLEEFQSQSDEISANLQKNLDGIEASRPEETLRRNLKVFEEMDNAAKQAAKSARDIGAGVQIGDTFFPRSDEVKARAKQFQQEYTLALDAIKKKLQSGGFQSELDAERGRNDSDFAAGRITEDEFIATKIELDSRTAQDQAALATEEVQRELDRNNAKLKVDMDFADSIRKELETAFLSPIDKFNKELEKIRNNPELTQEEKDKAEENLRKNTRESLVGKSPSEQFSDTVRDATQAARSGIISWDEALQLGAEASNELAKSLGLATDPSVEMNGAIGRLNEAFKKGQISAEQLAEGMKNARDQMLAELGIEKRPEEQDKERLDRLNKATGLTKEERARGRQAIEDDILGQSAGSKIADERRRIEEGMASGAIQDKGRGEAALRGLDAQRRSAAGIQDTPTQALQAGVDKINDAFDVAGMTMQEIQAKLSPEEFKQYQEAVKNNKDAIRQSLGIEKSAGEQLAESRKRLDDAVRAGIVTQKEANDAYSDARDEIRKGLGFTDAGSEYKKTLRELAKAAGDGVISLDEFRQGAEKAREGLLQSLGIPVSPIRQLEERMQALKKALNEGLISSEEYTKGQEEARRALLPGGEEESPVKKFQEDLKVINDAVSNRLISSEEGDKRKANLQAQLQEDLNPAQDSLAADRRLTGASDARSKGGVDTFFKILQGRDNPSLKAQLAIARNTAILAEAAQVPEAQEAIAKI